MRHGDGRGSASHPQPAACQPAGTVTPSPPVNVITLSPSPSMAATPAIALHGRTPVIALCCRVPQLCEHQTAFLPMKAFAPAGSQRRAVFVCAAGRSRVLPPCARRWRTLPADSDLLDGSAVRATELHRLADGDLLGGNVVHAAELHRLADGLGLPRTQRRALQLAWRSQPEEAAERGGRRSIAARRAQCRVSCGSAAPC
eukprot:359537-Chlamydomonas_euryale.AAC.2